MAGPVVRATSSFLGSVGGAAVALLPSAVVITVAPSAVNCLVDSAIAFVPPPRLESWRLGSLWRCADRCAESRRARVYRRKATPLRPRIRSTGRRKAGPPVETSAAAARSRAVRRTEPLVETPLTAEPRQFSRTGGEVLERMRACAHPVVKRVSQANLQTWCTATRCLPRPPIDEARQQEKTPMFSEKKHKRKGKRQ